MPSWIGRRPYLKIRSRSQIFNEISGNPPLVAIGLVVEIQHMRLRVKILLVLDKVLDSRHVRERLHTKLAVKAAPEGVEDLVFLLRSMPYYYWLAIALQL